MDFTRLVDFMSGKRIGHYHDIYKVTQWWSHDQMLEYQIAKLKKLVAHCYANVPYYRNLMLTIGMLPEDVKDLTILRSFPILTKEQIKKHYADFTPLNESELKGIKTSQTGGTTGNILNKRNDSETRSSIWGSYKRFYDWMGVKPGDKELTYWGGHVIKHGLKAKIEGTLINLVRNSVSFDAYDTNPITLERVSNTLRSGKVKLIRSYPQALYSLAQRFKQQNQELCVRSIMTTSEPLMPEHRELFRDVFGADSFDQYGCGEIGGIAYECDAHQGLHVTEERVILETNDNNELMITDLDNFAMPFIRYWNADQAIFSDHLCSCGRKSRVIEKVLGRTCDYLLGVNGQILHWAYFWHLLFDTEIAIKRNFIKFQVVQKSNDLIVFRTVSDPLSQEDKDTLTRMIREKMGNIRVEFVLEEDIDNAASGKYRPVVNELLENK